MNKKDIIHYLPFVTLVTVLSLIYILGENFAPMMLTFVMYAVPTLAIFFIVKWTFWPDHGFSEQQIANGAVLPELVWHQRLIKKWRNK
jgi:hypothetical protein